MKRQCYILVMALLLLLVSAASATAMPSMELPAPSSSEFCGTVPPAQIRCPKTSASRCVCALGSKSAQAEHELAPLQETVTLVRLPKHKPTPRLIPETIWSLASSTFVDSIPTPPPRS